MSARSVPLEGLEVLDFSQWLPGRLCTTLLLQRGARVTFIEPPWGDPMAQFKPEMCSALNRGKERKVLDLKAPTSIDEVARVLSSHSVVIEGYRPGVMERLGLGYHDLANMRQDVIVCSLPAYRAGSSLASLPVHDLAIEAFAGLLDPESPAKPRASTVDLMTGILAVIAVFSAVRDREKTGRGYHVEVPLADAGFFWSYLAAITASTDSTRGNGIFYGADRLPFALCVVVDSEWEVLWRVFASMPEVEGDKVEDWRLVQDSEDLLDRLGKAFSVRSRDFWVDRLSEAGLVARSVNSFEEAEGDPHFRDILVSNAHHGLNVELPARVLD